MAKKKSAKKSTQKKSSRKKTAGARSQGPRTKSEKAESRFQGRIKIPIKVQYRVTADFAVDLAEDISPGGIFVHTKTPLPPGTKVEMAFEIPGKESKPSRRVLAQGIVVWSSLKKTEGKRKPGMGIEFLKIDIQDQGLIDNVIHGLLRRPN